MECWIVGALRTALEQSSGRTVGEHLGLCYSPAFIALGSVIANLSNPDLILIGVSDAKAGALLERVLLSICDTPGRVRRMSMVNAELAKLGVNAFVTMKISFANME